MTAAKESFQDMEEANKTAITDKVATEIKSWTKFPEKSEWWYNAKIAVLYLYTSLTDPKKKNPSLDDVKIVYDTLKTEVVAQTTGTTNVQAPGTDTKTPDQIKDFTGKATVKYGDDIYTGDFQNGKKEWSGTLTYKTWDVYTGDFKNDKKEWKGILTEKSWDVYTGEWKNDIKEWVFLHKTPDGKLYTEGFKNDELESVAEYTWTPNGVKNTTETTTEVKNEKKEWKGTYTYKNGDIYTGDWKNGKREWKGTYIWKSWEKYVGDWKNDTKEWKGVFTWKSGNIYTWNWKNNKPEGQFAYKSVDGKQYINVYTNGSLVSTAQIIENTPTVNGPVATNQLTQKTSPDGANYQENVKKMSNTLDHSLVSFRSIYKEGDKEITIQRIAWNIIKRDGDNVFSKYVETNWWTWTWENIPAFWVDNLYAQVTAFEKNSAKNFTTTVDPESNQTAMIQQPRNPAESTSYTRPVGRVPQF